MSGIGRGIAVLSLCAFALGGCAGTGSMDLKTPIDGFATAAKTAQTTLQTYDAMLDAVVLQANTEAALKGDGLVEAAQGDCTPAATRCRIVLAGPSGDLPLSSTPQDPIAREVMTGIVTYSTNLQTIAAIDTQTDVKTATDATLANIGQLAKDLDGAATAAGMTGTNLSNTVSPLIAPFSDAVGTGLGVYLDNKKLDALRAATTAMNAILPKLIDLCGASIDAGVAEQRKNLNIAYRSAYATYLADKTSQPKLDALRTASNAYDASLSVDPRASFQALVTAHAALTEALKPESPSFTSALAAIQQAISAAQKVQALVQGIQAASKPAAT